MPAANTSPNKPGQEAAQPQHRRRRQLAASWRDTWLLLREFRWPLIAFFFTVVGGGSLYYALAQVAGEPLDNLLELILPDAFDDLHAKQR
jgi:hypothetical protein